jgi:NDP-sugar pyrophosphorylase family protein
MQAIILAGGKGTRLKPFTNTLPKPLVPIGDIPILEVILRQLKYYGVDRVTLAVSHMARLIQAFFERGEHLGISIAYSTEDKILGTSGPLKLIKELDEDFIVMNGDLLTTIDYQDLFEFHLLNRAAATIATFEKEIKIDLGVLETSGNEFKDYIEKPIYKFTVSMGIYILNRKVLAYIPEDKKFDMPELILALRDADERVVCYKGNYEWLDIGRVADYETALEQFEKKRQEYLPE